MNQTVSQRKIFSPYMLANISILSVIGFIIMLFSITLPFFPTFLSWDLSDLPVLVGTIAFGPVAGIVIAFVKNLIKFVLNTSTAGIGEFANFIVGVSLVIPMGIAYRYSRSVKGYFIGSTVGVLSTVVVACLLNYFVLIPAFARMFIPMEAIIGMGTAVNGSVTDLRTLVLFTIAPFNLLKTLSVVICGYFVLFKFNLLKYIKIKES